MSKNEITLGEHILQDVVKVSALPISILVIAIMLLFYAARFVFFSIFWGVAAIAFGEKRTLKKYRQDVLAEIKREF